MLARFAQGLEVEDLDAGGEKKGCRISGSEGLEFIEGPHFLAGEFVEGCLTVDCDGGYEVFADDP